MLNPKGYAQPFSFFARGRAREDLLLREFQQWVAEAIASMHAESPSSSNGGHRPEPADAEAGHAGVQCGVVSVVSAA